MGTAHPPQNGGRVGGGTRAGNEHSRSLKFHMVKAPATTAPTYGLILVESGNYHGVLNVNALVGTFNQEKVIVGAFSVIVKLKTSQSLVSISYRRHSRKVCL